MNTRSARLTLLGLACGVLLALLIAPQTRWLVKSQLLPPSLTFGNYDQQKRLFVQSHPHDYQIQLAGQAGFTATDSPETDSSAQSQLQYARSLVPRFPDNPSLRANILRYASSRIHVSRDEDYLISGQPIPIPDAKSDLSPPTPTELADFDADAAAGERLDPENAYFPWMRATGYFAAHRDAEGLAAVSRASEKHAWREYIEDEVIGHWRINDGVYGGREAIASSAFAASLLFPHYQHVRQTARIVAYKAILEEQAGHPEAGLALRRQMMHCGGLLMLQSHALIGSLVGIAICSVARGRPGGSPPLTNDSSLSNDQRAQQRLELYCAYVTRFGHPEDATEARAQFQEGEQIRHITAKVDTYLWGVSFPTFTRLAIALVVGWMTVPNIVNLILLGLLAIALSRLPRFQERQPLPPGTTAGVWLTLLMTFAVAIIFLGPSSSDFMAFAALLVFPPLAVVLLTAALLPRLRPITFSMLRAALLTAIVLGLYGSIAGWFIHSGSEILTTIWQTLDLSGSDTNNTESPIEKIMQAQTLLGLAFSLTIPLLLAIILSIAARVRRVPVSVGLVEGFQHWMPPLVCVLMFAYGGLILWTVQKEREVNYGLAQSLHGEGQYLAQLTGQTWPK